MQKNVTKLETGHGQTTKKLDSIEAINQFRKIIEIHINIKIGTIVKMNGEITDPGEDTITHLLSVHFPSATTKEKTQYNQNKYITKTELDKWEQNWITPVSYTHLTLPTIYSV